MNFNPRQALILLTCCSAVAASSIGTALAADAPITHQITLPAEQTWCSDAMINGLFNQVNSFRVKNGLQALSMSAVGMKDAEMRASQFATYMLTTSPTSPGFFPHQGYDTTAASLGYPLISENLAYISTDPSYIVNGIWQDSLHLAALLAPDAGVMGVSCVYDSGTAYWTYEPGSCSGTSCGTPPSPTPVPAPTPAPSGTPTFDSEEWAFLSLINTYRAQNGLGPLQVSVDLETAAKWMSTDMATKNYFSHTDSLGRSSGARIAAFGYSYFPWGENLAAGYSAAQDALNGWQTACDPDTSGACTYAHRQNMLAPGFTAIGIARAYDASSAYGWYWTTDFGGYVEQAITPPGSTPAPTPSPTPTPAAPAIASFTANPTSITAGRSATLSWSVTGAATITIDNGVGAVTAAASKAVSPAQTTTYTLSATNAGGTSTARATVTVTAAADTQAPSAPTLISAAAKSSTEIDVAWRASTDNVSVAGYQVLRNGVVLATVGSSTLAYADNSATAGATYAYSIKAFDSAGNFSAASNLLQASAAAAPAPVSTCPAAATEAFTGCYYSNTTLSGTPALVRMDPQINFDWGGNTPDRSVSRGSFSVRWRGQFTFAQGTYTFTALTSDGMRLYIDGALVLDRWSNQNATQYSVQQSLAQGLHSITVEYSEYTGWSVAHLTWQGGATAARAPAILSFAAAPSAVTPGQPSTLSWSVNGAASVTIDNGVGDVSGASSRTVTPSQTTTYTLTATNAAGSVRSSVTVTVASAQDTQPPTAPVLSAAANGAAEIDLSWSASFDNFGVTGYQIIRNGSALHTVPGSATSYADTVSAGTSYTYSLRAYDAAGNYSVPSNAVQVTTATAPASGASCAAPAAGAFTGCYYSNTTLSGSPALIRTDPQINFDWGGNPPDRAIGRGAFSVRWGGQFTFSQGAYTFTGLASDGMRVYIDGNLVLDHWTDQVSTQYAVQQTLSAGTHTIAVEYYEQSGWSSAHLSWLKN